MGVAAQTIWRWVTAYRKEGLDGLYPKPKRPKPSKLNTEQKAVVISWLGSGKTAKGENIHWTLSQLRNAITEECGVTLGINTIWVWLRKENRKLKVPRPKHYSADVQAQHTFKKNP
jgi:transposase